MHELPLIKMVFNNVMEYATQNNCKKVTLVCLQIGVLREFIPSYITKYWHYVAQGTICEGSIIEVEDIPVTCHCSQCQGFYNIDPSELLKSHCPYCGADSGEIVSGRELILSHIEVE